MHHATIFNQAEVVNELALAINGLSSHAAPARFQILGTQLWDKAIQAFDKP